jgi:hypothetical protein
MILIALFIFSAMADAKPKRSAKKSGARSTRTSSRRLTDSQIAAQKRAWDRSEQLRQRRLYEAAQRSAATAMNFQSRVDQAVFNIPPAGTFESKKYPIPEPAAMPNFKGPEIDLSPKTSSSEAQVERPPPEPRYRTEYVYIRQPEVAALEVPAGGVAMVWGVFAIVALSRRRALPMFRLLLLSLAPWL